MHNTTVKRDQSLFDIALQEYGHIAGIYMLLEDNPNLIGPTDNIYEGDQLLIRETVINSQMANYLRPYNIATVMNARGEGVGYWAIEVDFKVQ